MNNIADLKKPTFKNGKLAEDPNVENYLMKDEDFIQYQKETNKKLMWDNYFQNIGEDRQYKGQR